MTLFPVITRELRAEARHPFTYWVRTLGVAALLVAGVYFGSQRGFSARTGGHLFGYLNLTLFCVIWLLVPLLTADCLSRERRDGTLGLLFLTPLQAPEIVLAKGLAHGLRALTLWLAVLPVLAIPFLLGGVSWKEGVLSLLMNFSSLCWALAAGLLASSWNRAWLRSLAWAAIFGILFLFMLSGLNCLLVMASVWSALPGFSWSQVSRADLLDGGLTLVTNVDGWWSEMLRYIPAALHSRWLFASTATAVTSLLAMALVVRVAARNVQRRWQEEPPTARQLWWQQTFCTPVLWLSFFRRWLRRRLERNPIGWLEQRTWSGRLVVWSWLAVMVSVYSLALTEYYFYRNSFRMWQFLLAWGLMFSLASSSAGSFRRERETGVLELLLVTPLSVGQIIGGRLRGLWTQFLPAGVMLVGIWLFLAKDFEGQQQFEQMVIFCSTFLTLPIVGLYFSLRRSNFISAILWTVLVGLLLPVMLPEWLGWLGWLLDWVWTYDSSGGFRILLRGQFGLVWLLSTSIFLQMSLAVFFGRRLYRLLDGRQFAFDKAVT